MTEHNKIEFREKYLYRVLEEAIPNENVVEVLRKIHNRDNKIIIITARNDNEVKNVFELTKLWLKKYDINYDMLLIDCKDKADVCLKNNVEVFVDDSISNCISVYNELKIPVFLYSTRYNMDEKTTGIYRILNWDELNNKTVITKPLKFIDVEKKNEFPPVSKNSRYIHFYGGTKNYRAYIAPNDISRADFMELYPEYVPEQNQPIYENNGIIVRADPKFPCPGFYIFALNKTFRAFDLLDDVTFIRFCFILKKIKEGMRSELGINYAHLLSNEKSDPFVNVHFWLVPINGITSPDLFFPGIGDIVGACQKEDNFELLDKRISELKMTKEDYLWYLDLRKYGTVPHSGYGMGLERLVMYTTGIDNIRDTIPFPRTKCKKLKL